MNHSQYIPRFIQNMLSKNADLELTTNPDALFNSSIPVTDLTLHGIKINSNPSIIPKDKILTTTFDKLPKEAEQANRITYTDNKAYYEIDGNLKEIPIASRIESVLNSGGILHMVNGAKYVVKGDSVVGIGIHGDVLSPYKAIRKSSIERSFGKADKVNEEYENYDGTLFNTEYVYAARGFKILYDDWDKEIMLINIGRFYEKE